MEFIHGFVNINIIFCDLIDERRSYSHAHSIGLAGRGNQSFELVEPQHLIVLVSVLLSPVPLLHGCLDNSSFTYHELTSIQHPLQLVTNKLSTL